MVDGFADYPLSPSPFREETDMPMEYAGMKVRKLYKLKMSTFYAEEVLNAEKNCKL